MVMNTDRRVVLTVIAMGRITPAEAERLLAAWDESLETAWILAICLAQLNVHSLVPTLMQFFNAQVPAPAEAARKALSPITGSITDRMPLTRVEGLL
jgi:hypothetical protein